MATCTNTCWPKKTLSAKSDALSGEDRLYSHREDSLTSRAARLRFNAVFFGGLFIWTMIFLPLSFPLWLFMTAVTQNTDKSAIRKLVHFYGTIICRILASQTPVHVKNLAAHLSGPCIVIANHQSFFDPYCMGFFHLNDPAFVVRAWPFRIPLYGPIMRRAGYIDTTNLDAENFLRKAGDLLTQNAAIVIFPEGTRNSAGGLLRFHSGPFRLAMLSQSPIVPMCIAGSGRIFPKGSHLGSPAPLGVSLLEPVWPQAFAKFGDEAPLHLRRHVKSAIENEMKRINTQLFPCNSRD